MLKGIIVAPFHADIVSKTGKIIYAMVLHHIHVQMRHGNVITKNKIPYVKMTIEDIMKRFKWLTQTSAFRTIEKLEATNCIIFIKEGVSKYYAVNPEFDYANMVQDKTKVYCPAMEIINKYGIGEAVWISTLASFMLKGNIAYNYENGVSITRSNLKYLFPWTYEGMNRVCSTMESRGLIYHTGRHSIVLNEENELINKVYDLKNKLKKAREEVRVAQKNRLNKDAKGIEFSYKFDLKNALDTLKLMTEEKLQSMSSVGSSFAESEKPEKYIIYIEQYKTEQKKDPCYVLKKSDIAYFKKFFLLLEKHGVNFKKLENFSHARKFEEKNFFKKFKNSKDTKNFKKFFLEDFSVVKNFIWYTPDDVVKTAEYFVPQSQTLKSSLPEFFNNTMIPIMQREIYTMMHPDLFFARYDLPLPHKLTGLMLAKYFIYVLMSCLPDPVVKLYSAIALDAVKNICDKKDPRRSYTFMRVFYECVTGVNSRVTPFCHVSKLDASLNHRIDKQVSKIIRHSDFRLCDVSSVLGFQDYAVMSVPSPLVFRKAGIGHFDHIFSAESIDLYNAIIYFLQTWGNAMSMFLHKYATTGATTHSFLAAAKDVTIF